MVYASAQQTDDKAGLTSVLRVQHKVVTQQTLDSKTGKVLQARCVRLRVLWCGRHPQLSEADTKASTLVFILCVC